MCPMYFVNLFRWVWRPTFRSTTHIDGGEAGWCSVV